MMNIMVERDNWGERRLAARDASRRRSERLLVAATFAFSLGIPFIAGVIDGVTGRKGGMPPWSGAAMLIAWIAASAVAATLAWRAADEVQRRALVNTAAAAGAVGFLSFPVLGIAARWLELTDPGEAAWFASGAAALVAYVWQRGWA